MFPPPSFPTPLERCAPLNDSGVELFIKNDGLAHPTYGGNKVRKALRLLEEAERRGARRILTIGAVGSHHVLTMGIFAKAAGLGCAAVFIPQPRTEHVVDTVRASIGQGVMPICAHQQLTVPARMALARKRGDMFVPPGGSSVTSTLAYADAVKELMDQLAQARLAPPDVIVVALGSGGTAAGIAAGVIKHGLPSRVVGVQVVPGPFPRMLARRLCQGALRALKVDDRWSRVTETFSIDSEQLGRGYGHETEAGREATRLAAGLGLELEPTYTAKAFACVLALRRRAIANRSSLRILYWHTLSCAPLAPLLTMAPSEADLPAPVRALLGPG